MQTVNYWLSASIGALLVFIGLRFLCFPEQGELGFGIVFEEAQNYSFHYIKGIRDMVTGLLILGFLWFKNYRALGLVLLVGAWVPIVDTWVVWGYNQLPFVKTIPHVSAIVLCLATAWGWFNLETKQETATSLKVGSA